MKNLLLYFILISVFINANAGERNAIRALYKDDQRYQWLEPAPDDARKCCICFRSDGKISSLACHTEHRFHAGCINEWKQIKSNCPICRVEIVDSLSCTCLKSIIKPGVCMPLCMGLVYVLGKSACRINEYIQASEISSSHELARYCTGCAALCVFCSVGFALSPVIFCIKNYKQD